MSTPAVWFFLLLIIGLGAAADVPFVFDERGICSQVKELAEDMDFQVLHGIVDCLWVIGEPIASFKEAVERETGILTELDSYDWITFLPMADGT
jgi:hypothetical protein